MSRATRWVARIGLAASSALAIVACSDETSEVAGGPQLAGAPQTAAVVSYAYSPAAEQSLRRDAGPARPGGTIVQALTRDFGTLNNLLRVNASEELLCRTYLFPPLLNLDPDTYELVPLIAAERPTIAADRLTYTWKLRPGVYWHRGDERGPVELTSADLEFSWKMLADPAVKAEKVRAALGPIASVKAIDRYTFVVTVKQPYFRVELEFGFNFPIMPAHLAAHDAAGFNADPLGRAPVGYGPYRLREWKTGEYLELERNPDWPLADQLPYPIERLRYRFVADATQFPLLFARGELSLCTVNDCARWESLKADAEMRELATFHEYFLPQWLYVMWNTRLPQFADARVRRALTMLYPRELVKEKVYAGHAVVLNAPGSVTYAGYDPSVPPLPFDPVAAMKLLDDAGFVDHDGDGVRDRDGVALRFVLLHPPTPVPAIATGNLWFQEQAAKAGVAVTPEAVDFQQMQAQLIEHRFEAVLQSWVGDPRDDDLFDRFHSSSYEAGMNHGGYSSPECDALLEQFRGEFDDAARLELGRAIYGLLGRDLPFTPLYNPQALALVSTKLQNVKMRRMGARWFDWWLKP
ncbi:MAG: hypothetical protein EXS13_02520 [Planctomycetes bacterium]|nr:hypothetical protein [Planctomycetota bacterium]